MKNCKSSETRFVKVSRKSDLYSRGKGRFEVSIFFSLRNVFVEFFIELFVNFFVIVPLFFSLICSSTLSCFLIIFLLTGEANSYVSPWEHTFRRCWRFSTPGSFGGIWHKRDRPNASECIRSHPGRSEQVQTRPRTSKTSDNWKKHRKLCEKFRKKSRFFWWKIFASRKGIWGGWKPLGQSIWVADCRGQPRWLRQ